MVKDPKSQVESLAADLRTSSDDPGSAWGRELKADYRTASERGRTGFSWSEWRDDEVDLAAVAWITGEGRRHGQAADNETEFSRAEPSVCGSAVTGRGPG